MNNKFLNLMALLAIPSLFSACISTTGGGGGNLQNVVNQNSQAITQMQGQLSGIQPAQADSWSQLQAIRQEIAMLRGEIDNLKNSTSHLGGINEVGNVISKHDQALRSLENQLAMNFNLDAPSQQYNNPSANSGNTGYYNPMPNQNIQNQNIPNQNQGHVTQPNQNNQVLPNQNTNSTDTAQALYDSGINNFNSRNYANALNSFVDFTKVYPNHTLTSNAWFWQGESNYQLKNYAAAALAYENVIKSYPNSIKAPASYLKQGMAFLALNRPEAAKERLNYLIATYPKSAEAKRAQTVVSEM